jgi:hypothetical protein
MQYQDCTKATPFFISHAVLMLESGIINADNTRIPYIASRVRYQVEEFLDQLEAYRKGDGGQMAIAKRVLGKNYGVNSGTERMLYVLFEYIDSLEPSAEIAKANALPITEDCSVTTASVEVCSAKTLLSDSEEGANKLVQYISEIYHNNNVEENLRNLQTLAFGTGLYLQDKFWHRVFLGCAMILNLTLNDSLVSTMVKNGPRLLFGRTDPQGISKLLESFNGNQYKDAFKRFIAYILIPVGTDIDLSVAQVELIHIKAAEKIDISDLAKSMVDAVIYVDNIAKTLTGYGNLAGIFSTQPKYFELCAEFKMFEMLSNKMKLDPGAGLDFDAICSECSHFMLLAHQAAEIEYDDKTRKDIDRMETKVASLLIEVRVKERNGKVKPAPYTVIAVGSTSVGKSTITNTMSHIVYQLMENKPLNTTKLYTVGGGEKFPNIDSDAEVIVFDDLCNELVSASSTGSSPLAMLNERVQNFHLPIPAADLHRKNKVFPEERVIVASTNVADLQADMLTIEVASALRRFRVWLHPKVKDEYRKVVINSKGELEKTGFLDSAKMGRDFPAGKIPNAWWFDINQIRVQYITPPYSTDKDHQVKHKQARVWQEPVTFMGKQMVKVDMHELIAFLEHDVKQFKQEQAYVVDYLKRFNIINLCSTCLHTSCICVASKRTLVEPDGVIPHGLDCKPFASARTVYAGVDQQDDKDVIPYLTSININVTDVTQNYSALMGLMEGCRPYRTISIAPIDLVEAMFLIFTDKHTVNFVKGKFVKRGKRIFLNVILYVDLFSQSFIIQDYVLCTMCAVSSSFKNSIDLLYRDFSSGDSDGSECGDIPHGLPNAHSSNFDDEVIPFESIYKRCYKSFVSAITQYPLRQYKKFGKSKFQASMLDMLGYDSDFKGIQEGIAKIAYTIMYSVTDAKVFHYAVWIPNNLYNENIVASSVYMTSKRSMFDRAWQSITTKLVKRVCVLAVAISVGHMAFPLVLAAMWYLSKLWKNVLSNVLYNYSEFIIPFVVLCLALFMINANFIAIGLKIACYLTHISSFSVISFGTGISYIVTKCYKEFWEIIGNLTEVAQNTISLRRSQLEDVRTNNNFMSAVHTITALGVLTSSDVAEAHSEYYAKPHELVLKNERPKVLRTSDELMNYIENNMVHISTKETRTCAFIQRTGEVLSVWHFYKDVPDTFYSKLTILRKSANHGGNSSFSTMVSNQNKYQVKNHDLIRIHFSEGDYFKDITETFTKTEESTNQIIRIYRDCKGIVHREEGLITNYETIETNGSPFQSRGFRYSLPSAVGLCGALILTKGKNSRIIGMHIAEFRDGTSGAIWLTQDTMNTYKQTSILRALDAPDPTHMVTKYSVGSIPRQTTISHHIRDGQIDDYYQTYGKIGEYTSVRDTIVYHSIHDQLENLGLHCTHVSPFRNHDGTKKPIYSGKKKLFSRAVIQTGMVSPQELSRAARDYFLPFEAIAAANQPTPMSLGEVLNGRPNSRFLSGIDISTSTGPPENRPKTDFISVINGTKYLSSDKINELGMFVTMLLNDKVPDIVAELSDKLEPKKIKLKPGSSDNHKISTDDPIPDPRVFHSVSFKLNMLLMQLYGPIFELFFDNNILAETALGFNPYHPDIPTEIYNYCTFNGTARIKCLDVERFDLCRAAQQLNCIFCNLIRLAKIANYPQKKILIMEKLGALICRSVLKFEGIALLLLDILPSGMYGTTLLGGMSISLSYRCCFFSYANVSDYRYYNHLITNGDDSVEGNLTILGIPRFPFYDCNYVVEYFKEKGIILTSANKSDDIDRFSQCFEFLGRVFVKHKELDRIVPQLNWRSMMKMIHIAIKSKEVDMDEVLYQSLVVFLKELVFYGKKDYNDTVRKLRDIDNQVLRSTNELWWSYEAAVEYFNMYNSHDRVYIDPSFGSYLPKANAHEAEQPTVAGIATAVAKFTGKLSSIPVLRPYMLATSAASGALGSIAQALGFSRPTITDAEPPVVVQGFQAYSTINVKESAKKLAVDQKNEVVLLNHDGIKDPLAVSELAGKWSFLCKTEFLDSDAVNAPILTLRVTPNQFIAVGGSYKYLTSSAIACIPFDLWTGTVEYEFEVVKPILIGGALLIQYDPSHFSAGSPLNAHHGIIWDFLKEDKIRVRIAPSQETTFMTTKGLLATSAYMKMDAAYLTSSTDDNGCLTLRVFNRLNAPNNATVGFRITILVRIRMVDDLEVARPNNVIGTIGYKKYSAASLYDWQTDNDEEKASTEYKPKHDYSFMLTLIAAILLYGLTLIVPYRYKRTIDRWMYLLVEAMRDEHPDLYAHPNVRVIQSELPSSREIALANAEVLEDIQHEESKSWHIEDTELQQRVDTSIGLEYFLGRKIEIFSTDLTVGDRLHEYIDPWSIMLQNATIKDKLALYKNFRGDIIFTVYISSSKLYYGRFMIAYTPYFNDEYWPYAEMDNGSPVESTIDAELVIASQLNHIDISPADTESKELRVPFHYKAEFINLLNDQQEEMGRLLLTSYTQLLASNETTDKVTLRILAQFDNVSYRGVTCQPLYTPAAEEVVRSEEITGKSYTGNMAALTYVGESISSFRQMIKRRTPYVYGPVKVISGTKHTELILDTNIVPPGRSTTLSLALGTSLSGLLGENPVAITWLSYARYLFAGMRGSIRLTYVPTINTGKEYFKISVNRDAYAATAYKYTEYTPSSRFRSDNIDAEEECIAGTELSTSTVNPILDVEIPYQSQYLFQAGRSSGASGSYPRLRIMGYDRTGTIADHIMLSAGEDIQFIGFMGPPVIVFPLARTTTDN